MADGQPAAFGAVADEQVAALLGRAYELARSNLAGLEEAAKELASMSGDSPAAISGARRVALERLARTSGQVDLQVVSLLRRAIEVGASRWTWEETKPVP